MDKVLEMEGQTVEEAIDQALEKLGTSRDEVEVEILDEANKGLLGLRKGKLARVRVWLKDDIQEAVKAVVQQIIAHFPISADIETRPENEALWVELKGQDLAVLIGHHGQTLDALQLLANAIIKKTRPSAPRIVVEVEGYRARRQEQLQALAERMVGVALSRQEPVVLRPMNAYERKIIHTVVAEHDGVSSSSSGEEPDRQVTIYPA